MKPSFWDVEEEFASSLKTLNEKVPTELSRDGLRLCKDAFAEEQDGSKRDLVREQACFRKPQRLIRNSISMTRPARSTNTDTKPANLISYEQMSQLALESLSKVVSQSDPVSVSIY